MVAEDLTKANLREGSPNLLQMALSGVGKQVTSESTDSHSAHGLGGTKNNQVTSSKPKVPTTHSSGPGPPVVVQQVAAVKIPMSQDRRSPIWPCTSLKMMISLMTHTRLYPLRTPLLDRGYLLRAEVTRFLGFYYHKSGDVRPGYTGASPWDYPLDCQWHVA